MKITRILLFSILTAVAFSCSEDDDAKSSSSDLEKASLSFAGDAKVIAPPSAMASSEDTYAMMANSYITQANLMTNYLSYFTPPSGATKSSTAITASNGRVAAAQTEYLVYTWSDPNYGSIAYQISQESDKWVFEIFFKGKGQSSWLRYVYAEEQKDKSSGFMNIYDIFTGDGGLLLNYAWTRSGDVLTFVLSESASGLNVKVTIVINEKTKAGSVLYTIDGAKFYEMEWDAQGNGSWAIYEDDGTTVLEEGTWTV